jgi:AcrR family transcriptional regulator
VAADRTRIRILAAAGEVVGDQGLDAAMAEVARRVALGHTHTAPSVSDP